jgi:hypothetical protein
MMRAIDELRKSNIPALKRRYRELFGEESKSSNKQYLFRRLAWRLQPMPKEVYRSGPFGVLPKSPTIAICVSVLPKGSPSTHFTHPLTPACPRIRDSPRRVR